MTTGIKRFREQIDEMAAEREAREVKHKEWLAEREERYAKRTSETMLRWAVVGIGSIIALLWLGLPLFQS